MQVLELVLPFISDIRSLKVCYNLDQHHRALTVAAIQRGWAWLLKAQLSYIQKMGFGSSKPLKWLCERAGAATINSAAGKAVFLEVLALSGAHVIYHALPLIRCFISAGMPLSP